MYVHVYVELNNHWKVESRRVLVFACIGRQKSFIMVPST